MQEWLKVVDFNPLPNDLRNFLVTHKCRHSHLSCRDHDLVLLEAYIVTGPQSERYAVFSYP